MLLLQCWYPGFGQKSPLLHRGSPASIQRKERGITWNERLFKRQGRNLSDPAFSGVFWEFLSGLFMRFSSLFSGSSVSGSALFGSRFDRFYLGFFPLKKSRGLPERKDFSDTGGPGKTVRKEKRRIYPEERRGTTQRSEAASGGTGGSDRIYREMVP